MASTKKKRRIVKQPADKPPVAATPKPRPKPMVNGASTSYRRDADS